MEQAVATGNDGGNVLESVILKGDISLLTPMERVQYYRAVCESVGLNPLTQPFAYIKLQGKETLYAKREATDQLRQIHGVSVVSCEGRYVEDIYIVTVGVKDKTGRTDMATGAVMIGASKGDNLANAMMKAETKAKRRATLSLCGLGLLDETELETVPTEHEAGLAAAQAEVAAIDAKVHDIFKPKGGHVPQDEPTPIHHFSDTDTHAADIATLKSDYDTRLQQATTFKEAAQVREEVLMSDIPHDWKQAFELRFKQKFQMDKGRK